MPGEQWGQKVTQAFQAVRQVHTDCSRLLLDLDRALVEHRSVYGSYAMMNISYDVKLGAFMPDALLRHWVHADSPNTVIAVNIAFWLDGVITEPLFIAAKMIYAEPLKQPSDARKAWDPWHSHLKWAYPRVENLLVETKPPVKRPDLLRCVSVGVPLASISSESVGTEWLRAVQHHTFRELVTPQPQVDFT